MVARSKAACLGAATVSVRTTEYMERCQLCGTEIQFQLVNHPFWGFAAGCDFFAKKDPASVTDGSVMQPGSRVHDPKETINESP